MPIPRLHPIKKKGWYAEKPSAAPTQPSFEQEPGDDGRRQVQRREVASDDPRRAARPGRKWTRCTNCRRAFYSSADSGDELCTGCRVDPTRFTDPLSPLGVIVYDSQWRIDRRAEFGMSSGVPTARECYRRTLLGLNDEQHDRRE
jgi:hypothetical protein